jgi:ribonuclease HII
VELVVICGIDEAGRGSMIGPLVVAGITMAQSKIKKLGELGVKDSKKLTPLVRERLYKEIIKISDDYAVIKSNPKQIDAHVLNHKLNHLEAASMAKIIKKLQPTVSYVDSCDVNAVRFGKELSKLARTGKVKSYHHADSRFLVVSAASIIAKVNRDREIAKLRKLYDLGSGYPSDSKTIQFVREWFLKNGKMPEFVRKSWKPVKNMTKSYALA